MSIIEKDSYIPGLQGSLVHVSSDGMGCPVHFSLTATCPVSLSIHESNFNFVPVVIKHKFCLKNICLYMIRREPINHNSIPILRCLTVIGSSKPLYDTKNDNELRPISIGSFFARGWKNTPNGNRPLWR